MEQYIDFFMLELLFPLEQLIKKKRSVAYGKIFLSIGHRNN